MTLQMAENASPQLPVSYSEPPDAKGDKFTQSELGWMLALRTEGKTQVEIAQRLGRSQAAVSKALKRLGADTTQLAQHHLKAKSYSVARRLARIAEKSDSDDMAIKAGKVVLAGAGVIQSGQQVTVNNAVLIAQPDDPRTWGPGPAFEGVIEGESVSARGDDNAKT